MAKEMNLSQVKCFGIQIWWLNRCLALGILKTHSWLHIGERWTLWLVTSRVIRWTI